MSEEPKDLTPKENETTILTGIVEPEPPAPVEPEPVEPEGNINMRPGKMPLPVFGADSHRS